MNATPLGYPQSEQPWLAAVIDWRPVLQLSRQQLITAKRYLKEAFEFIVDVQAILPNIGDGGTASRLTTIADAIRNEIEHLDRLLGRQP